MSREPVDAETALELYLSDRANELAAASLKGQNTASGTSSGGAVTGIENLNTLSGR